MRQQHDCEVLHHPAARPRWQAFFTITVGITGIREAGQGRRLDGSKGLSQTTNRSGRGAAPTDARGLRSIPPARCSHCPAVGCTWNGTHNHGRTGSALTKGARTNVRMRPERGEWPQPFGLDQSCVFFYRSATVAALTQIKRVAAACRVASRRSGEPEGRVWSSDKTEANEQKRRRVWPPSRSFALLGHPPSTGA
jgi:hypothetical protein